MICCFLTVVIKVREVKQHKAFWELLQTAVQRHCKDCGTYPEQVHSQNPPQLHGQGSQAKGARGSLLRSTKASSENQQRNQLSYENRVSELGLHSCSGAQPATVAISAFVPMAWGKPLPKQQDICMDWYFSNVMFFKCCLKLKVCSVPLRMSLQILPGCLYVSSCFIASFSYAPKRVKERGENI